MSLPDLLVSYWAGRVTAPGWTVLERGQPFTNPAPIPAHRRLILAGFSAGAQAVRAHVLAGVKADAVVCVDGISEAWPKPIAMRIDAWRKLADEARKGERAFILTHTRQTYTEQLAKPFASTLTTARLISGMALDEPIARYRDGKFLVWSCPSKPYDPDAHRHQGQVVAGEALREALDLVEGIDRDVVTPREPSSRPPVPPGLAPLGVRALEVGLRFVGTHEIAGPKADPTIAGWLMRCQRGGRKLGLASDEIAWCAAFASACAFDACVEGETPPHEFRASVAELWADAIKVGAARHAEWAPAPGDLAIFRRGTGDPRTGGTGHVARVVEPPAPGSDGTWRFRTLDGNHNNEVAVVDRRVDAELVGWLAYPAGELASMSQETAARLVALSDAVRAGKTGLT